MIEDIASVRRAIGSLMSHGGLTANLDAPHGHQRMGAEVYKVAIEALDRLEEIANVLGEFEAKWSGTVMGPPTVVLKSRPQSELFDIAVRMSEEQNSSNKP